MMPHRLTAVLIALAAATGSLLARPGWLTAVDREQLRLDRPAPVPRGEFVIAQTFVAAHNGLSAVELLAVSPANSPASGALTLRLFDSRHLEIARATFRHAPHNAPLVVTFGPLARSAGKIYTLQLEGAADNQSTVWSYSLDGIADGRLLVDGAPADGDLRFITKYSYLWPDILLDAAVASARVAEIALPLWLVLFAPGLLVLDLVVGRSRHTWRSPWERWGMALGISISLVPLVWLWTTVLRLRWWPTSLGMAYAVIGLALLGRRLPIFVNHLKQAPRFWDWRMPSAGHHLGMVLVISLSLLARLLAIRDLVLPQWVDSPHHLTIARLFADGGRVPAAYVPLLPIPQFIYHFGLHALVATVHWLTGLSLSETLLLFGQVLNALAPLAIYPVVCALTDRPRAGLAAAFFVGLVSLFPAYYVSWGRYSHLAGLLILAPAMAAVWRLRRRRRPSLEGQSARMASTAEIMVVAVLGGGLALSHYSLLVFFILYALITLAASKRQTQLSLSAGALIAALLVLPWMLQLWPHALRPVLTTPGLLAAPAHDNAFPWAYFASHLERGWLTVAAVSLSWGLIRRQAAIAVTAAWVVGTLLVLNVGVGTWLANNSAWAITIFVPGAIALGWSTDQWLSMAVTRVGHPISRGHRLLGLAMLAAASGLAFYAGVSGLITQLGIANPATRLVTSDDTHALDWIDTHLPSQAVVLINGWEWLNGTWAGTDGGIWIWPLTDRRTTLPVLDYAYDMSWRPEVTRLNESLAGLGNWDSAAALALLRQAGVTHIYIGAKGGRLSPEQFLNKGSYRLLFTNGAAWVFEVASSGVQGQRTTLSTEIAIVKLQRIRRISHEPWR